MIEENIKKKYALYKAKNTIQVIDTHNELN